MKSPSLRRVALIAASVTMAASCFAADTSATAPTTTDAFTPAPLFPASHISESTLANGVRGVVRTTKNTDLVSIQVWVRAGSRYESASESGLAHLVESAAMRASKDWPAGDSESGGPAGAIQALGGTVGSLTSRDSTFYSAEVASPYFPSALHILANLVLYPDLSDSGVEAGKLQLENDALRIALDPVASATDLAYAKAYLKSSYRRPAFGDPSNIDNLTSAKARGYHERWYVGPNISVVVVGDVAVDEAQILIGREFGTASSGKPPVVTTAPEAPLEKQIVAHHTRANGGAIVLAWRSTGIDKPEDVVAMDTLLSLWREGLDANLRKLLMRDGEKGPNTPLVASYDVDYLTQRDPGLFAVDLSDPQDSDAAVQAVLDEVKRVQTQGISDAELERAKDELRSQYVIQSDTVNGQGGALGFYDMINNYRFGQYYLDRAARVTAADVQRVAKAYLSPDNYIRVDISPLPPPSQDEGGGPAITAEVPATGHLVTWHTESSR